MKILIADDEEIVRASLDGILQKGGYETDFALDGEETVNKVKNDLYDALLLDLDMPKLSGYEVLKQVRSVYPAMPVVFVTAKGEVKKVAQSIARDKLTAFIEKPFTPEKVLEILSKALINR